ncbi:hypothetical protein [Sphingomonas oryzagri]
MAASLLAQTSRGVEVAFAIKATITEPPAGRLIFLAQKTMYGGKQIAVDAEIFLFASENMGGSGLVARGVVTAAAAVARTPSVERQTPRMDVTIAMVVPAIRRLGRRELKEFDRWGDGRPETELNFKLYRQATDKIVGLADGTADFLRSFFL